jgi:electron transfer flavoprotein alpha subunit
MAGMSTSKVIVVINKDPEAPIFSKADFGVVGDIFQVLPAIAQSVKIDDYINGRYQMREYYE